MARAFVVDQLAAHGLLGLVDDARLVVSELATNATLHAGTPFTVIVESDGSVVRLAVDDSSPAPPQPSPSDAWGVGGRGLEIVAALSSSWGTTSFGEGCKRVWAAFEL